MLKKTLTYEDFDGNKITEDFYFNLTEAEAVELEMSRAGGLSTLMTKIMKARDGAAIVELFTEIMKKSYGVRSDDGRRFIKNDRVWEEFHQTNAYSDLFMALVTSDDSGSDFINGIIPKDLKAKMKAASRTAAENGTTEMPADVDTELPAEKKASDWTEDELLAMSQEDFDRIIGTDPRKMSKEHMVIAFQRKSVRV